MVGYRLAQRCTVLDRLEENRAVWGEEDALCVVQRESGRSSARSGKAWSLGGGVLSWIRRVGAGRWVVFVFAASGGL